MSAIPDFEARRRALDPGRSFIVQAPAGSGKTELLIQRFLRLLTGVREPEQVVAITFTRKAAAEMRHRVLEALHAAAAADRAIAPHRAATLEIARAVLSRDAERGWSLLAQPQRLRIDTLDALNAWLARQLPILAGGIAGAELDEEPQRLYALAAQRTLGRLGEPNALGDAAARLLEIAGNATARLESLLAQLLPARDQWLRHLLGGDEHDLGRTLERALTELLEGRVARLAALAGEETRRRLAPLLAHAARHATRGTLRDALAVWLRLSAFPARGPDALEAWKAASALLLTGAGGWRNQVTKGEGFGPEHAARRAELAALIGELRGNDALGEALGEARLLPELRYAPGRLEDLAALRTVLRHLVAELRVVFAEHRSVDFIELALAAEQALGRSEDPSSLLLALDQRIEHVLVDEFQDTSHAQLRLLELLTAGWTPDDGRSLFLVGDPMQSIYRFRDADMSLFLRAKRYGLGAVPLELIVLESNFRSAPGVVEWVNGVFAAVFPARDDLDRGLARFYPCRATRPNEVGQGVVLHALEAEHAEAEIATIVEVLEAEASNRPEQSIAILVQSRSRLAGLQTLLRQRGIEAQAVEIESLAETEIGQDLIGLTRALLHRGDRIAWLAVLRAPWCGLRWADLETLCRDDAAATIPELLEDPARLAALSLDGRERAEAVRTIVARADAARSRHTLSGWVESVWQALGGPDCARGEEDLARAAQFFAGLQRLARDGDLDDPAGLDKAFAAPVKQPDPSGATGIEIMTIHRAKGLEFDTVILFGLGQRVRGPETRALHWQQRIGEDGGVSLLLAPFGAETDPLTSFLRRAERERDAAEKARLLYVATTRARERLHVVARLDPGRSSPVKGSLLAHLWPVVGEAFRAAAKPVEAAPPTTAAREPLLRRFVEVAVPASGLGSAPVAAARGPSRPEFEWARPSAASIGTVVHEELQRLAALDRDPPGLVADVEARGGRHRAMLALLGVPATELDEAAERVRAALARALEDPVGRWILGPHAEAHSELAVTLRREGFLEHVRLDRTFVDDGVRWIIDFKTSTHEGGDLHAFLDSEVDRYRPQLERYARAVAAFDDRPIRVGLYFPLLGRFRDWAPAGRGGTTAR